MKYLLAGLCISLLMNGVLLVRLVRRSQALRSALRAIDEGSRELALVVHHLVQISKRHTQLRAELREAQGVIDEQDRALQVQRMLLARMRGAACPCERGRR
jgi:hypothetical protein